ncbi:MAG: dTMP kinase [Pseudomonadota bacterium]|uniref:Thymidylate kinase n=1 Tax=Candidatus Desulfatibia profunda TaxID=2841695 RepID=A0A8J6TM77_9BACT|nr:dTMP kinase [Candidatus Desulfatibia profunda]MBL7179866.1 dTMP kinase [Desulfobacterales bacterium]MBU0699155.1 dTMP kinase [Pseudomonadota bacterium]
MFITLEGIEGSGKTTQAKHIVEFLQGKGYECVATREPGGTEIGKKIRAILLDPESNDMDPLVELLLYTADRAQHVKQIVLPLLSAGKMVLCDRYYDATLVYQGFARGLDIGLIRSLHQLILADLKPDITILLDLAPQEGLSRAWKQIKNGARADIESRFEKETLLFHEKVRSGYLELSRLEPERFRVVDASTDEFRVRKTILKILASELKLA